MDVKQTQFEGNAAEAAARQIQIAAQNLAALVGAHELTTGEQLLAVATQAELGSALAKLAIADALLEQADAFRAAYQVPSGD